MPESVTPRQSRAKLYGCIVSAFVVAGHSAAWGQDAEPTSQGATSVNARRWQAWLEQRLVQAPAKVFPRFGWAFFGYYGNEVDVAEIDRYASAGFTEVQAKLGTAFEERARSKGLGIIAGTWEGAEKDQARRRRVIDAAKARRSITMVIVKDEPDRDTAMQVGGANEAVIADTPPRVLPVVTVVPGNASTVKNRARFDPARTCGQATSYCDFLENVINGGRAAAVLPTLYPIYEDGADKRDFYDQLTMLANTARKEGIGLFGSVLVTPHQDAWTGRRYRMPSASDVQWLANSQIAFGARGLSFYSYRTKTTDKADPKLSYGDGLVTTDGKPTATFDEVKLINCSLSAIGSTLMNLEVASLRGIGGGLQTVRMGSESALVLDARGDGFLISELRKRNEKLSSFAFLVNTLHGSAAKDQAIDFRIDPSRFDVTALEASESCNLKTTAASTANGRIKLTIPPGRAVLLKFKQKDS